MNNKADKKVYVVFGYPYKAYRLMEYYEKELGINYRNIKFLSRLDDLRGLQGVEIELWGFIDSEFRRELERLKEYRSCKLISRNFKV